MYYRIRYLTFEQKNNYYLYTLYFMHIEHSMIHAILRMFLKKEKIQDKKIKTIYKLNIVS